jgi:hypothetical protein
LHHRFGLSGEPAVILQDVLDKAPRMSSIAAQLLLQEIYQTTHGIYDHRVNSLPSAPVKIVCMHTKENVDRLSASSNFRRRFAVCGIAKLTGMSYSEFVECTKAECDDWFEIAETVAKKENSVLANALGTKEK